MTFILSFGIALPHCVSRIACLKQRVAFIVLRATYRVQRAACQLPRDIKCVTRVACAISRVRDPFRVIFVACCLRRAACRVTARSIAGLAEAACCPLWAFQSRAAFVHRVPGVACIFGEIWACLGNRHGEMRSILPTRGAERRFKGSYRTGGSEVSRIEHIWPQGRIFCTSRRGMKLTHTEAQS